jgi:hypothetical protein
MKLRDLHARGTLISSDPKFFHIGGGMSVRNLCREQLGDDELADYGGLGADWDSCYVGCSRPSLRYGRRSHQDPGRDNCLHTC